MLRLLTTLLFVTAINTTSFAQCDKCDEVSGDKIDYCFTHEAFPNKCASFVSGAEYLYLQKKGGDVTKIDMPSGSLTDIAWLIQVSENKKLKTSGADILFLERAIEDWKSAEKTLNMLTTPSGLKYKFFEKGTGKLPESGKNVSVHYKGYLENGNEFDNSFKRGQPISFMLGVGKVIKGWDEGIQLFPVGSKGILRIPPELGYGARGAGASIPPNSVLFFEIEVVSAD